MDNKINCGIDKIKYNEKYKLIKKTHKNVKQLKYYLKINYITFYFFSLYKDTKRKDLKLLTDNLIKMIEENNEFIIFNNFVNLFNQYELPINIHSIDGILYSRGLNKHKIKNINLFYYEGYFYGIQKNE